jgi:DNA repair exonuclease SbcCD nuclease subunit
MKPLLVGDLHAQLSNLEDTELLGNFIVETIKVDKVDSVIFTGDIYHNHAVLRQEIIKVVQELMHKISDAVMPGRVYVVVGNHDGMSPTDATINSVRQTLGHIVDVVDVDAVEDGDFTMVGFESTQEKFLKKLEGTDPKNILICHQTFDGAKYENGFYAPGGLDQSLVPQSVVLAGHIHSNQTVGKINYLGTPRAVTFGEARDLNDGSYPRKGIYVIETVDPLTLKFLETPKTIKRYYTLSITEGQENLPLTHVQVATEGNSELRINVTGSQDFYDRMCQEYASAAKKIQFVPNIVRHIESSLESAKSLDGFSIETALHEYVFKVNNDTDENKEKVWLHLQGLMPNLGKHKSI